MKTRIINLLYITLILGTTFVKAQISVPVELITPVEHALHGYATAISGEWAIATSPQKDVNGAINVGGATFYQKIESDWVIAQEVLPDDATALSNFGISVAMDGNTAVFGSMLNSESGLFSGAAYVYSYVDTTWVQSAKLVASDAEAGHRFGHSVSIIGNTIVVGAYQANGNEPKSGAAYVFEYANSSWKQTAKLFSENGESNDYFGFSLDLKAFNQDTLLAVGAYNATGSADRSGSVFTYSKTNGVWNQTSEIFDMAGTSADLFGYSISFGCEIAVVFKSTNSLDGCYDLAYAHLFIGAPGTNNELGQTGSVYYFSDLSQGIGAMSKLEEQSSANKDHFGTGITYLNNELFVSAPRTNTNEASHIGNVYSYSIWENVVSKNSFSSGNETPYGYFGSSVSSSGSNLLISAPYETVDGKENAGAVYFYNYPLVSDELETDEISTYRLEQNYPNPFNPSTTIRYQVKDPGLVKLTVFNLLGQVVQELVNEEQITGTYSASFNASFLASGFYFYRLEVNDFVSTRKMMLIK